MKNSIHMLASVDGGQMNSFIITTEGGHVIVIDGGENNDAANLIDHLKALTGKDIPHIDAWILSHPHADHISAFLQIMETMRDAVTVGKVYYNFPSAEYIARHQPWPDGSPARFFADLPLFADKAVIVTMGDTFDAGDAHFDCLYSPNPELTMNVCNNASLVLKMTLGGKSVIWLGDAGEEEGDRILALCGDPSVLKADYVQMAHHGQNGVKKDFYEAVAPTGCFWNTPKWLWENDAGLGYNTHGWKTIEVQGWMADIGVAEHYVMMNGDQTVDL
ncbi:MAG: MBL fold metallo-hydrolase [Clostridia bacterium]|nr:MBL fold metallo-hydrolase [Clostridia bacterium]